MIRRTAFGRCAFALQNVLRERKLQIADVPEIVQETRAAREKFLRLLQTGVVCQLRKIAADAVDLRVPHKRVEKRRVLFPERGGFSGRAAADPFVPFQR